MLSVVGSAGSLGGGWGLGACGLGGSRCGGGALWPQTMPISTHHISA